MHLRAHTPSPGFSTQGSHPSASRFNGSAFPRNIATRVATSAHTICLGLHDTKTCRQFCLGYLAIQPCMYPHMHLTVLRYSKIWIINVQIACNVCAPLHDVQAVVHLPSPDAAEPAPTEEGDGQPHHAVEHLVHQVQLQQTHQLSGKWAWDRQAQIMEITAATATAAGVSSAPKVLFPTRELW